MPMVDAELKQKQESHDVLSIQFKGALERHNSLNLAEGDPVKFVWETENHTSTFVGFVHLIEKYTKAANVFTRIVCVNNSEVLKKTGKELFKNKTADAIVSKICSDIGFSLDSSLVPYSYPSVAQAGQSHWQLLKRLSKATGHALRAENTELIFKKQDAIIAEKLPTAPVFTHFKLGPAGMASYQTLINFIALDAKDSLELNQGDLGIAVSSEDGQDFKFARGYEVTNAGKMLTPVSLPPDWQETYGVVPDATIDGEYI
jgi:hypothetical protein